MNATQLIIKDFLDERVPLKANGSAAAKAWEAACEHQKTSKGQSKLLRETLAVAMQESYKKYVNSKNLLPAMEQILRNALRSVAWKEVADDLARLYMLEEKGYVKLEGRG